MFGIFDLMGSNDLTYPMPWANDAASSYVEPSEAYHRQLRAAGFTIAEDHDRSVAIAKLMNDSERQQREHPTALGAPIMLGTDIEPRLANVMTAQKIGQLEPRLLIAVRPV